MLAPPIDRPEGPEDDANKHPNGESGWGKDDVSCFGKAGLLAGEVGNEGNKEEAALEIKVWAKGYICLEPSEGLTVWLIYAALQRKVRWHHSATSIWDVLLKRQNR